MQRLLYKGRQMANKQAKNFYKKESALSDLKTSSQLYEVQEMENRIFFFLGDINHLYGTL